MGLINYLERRNIATLEELKGFSAALILYFISIGLLKYHLSWWGMSILIAVIGGMCNLYVIDFNNLSMPVFARSRKEFKKIKKKNPNRRMCMLNSKTKIGWLADRFCLGKSIYSLGDFIVFFGVALAVLPFIIVFAVKII